MDVDGYIDEKTHLKPDDFRISVLVSKQREWLLRGFFRQWLKYYDSRYLETEVVGFGNAPQLPPKTSFYSIGAPEDYPADRWSDALIEYLKRLTVPVVVLMLEDYWLMRQVNTTVLNDCMEYALNNIDRVLRIDLTSDRVEGGRPTVELDSFGVTDFVMSSTVADYNISLQAAIWNREKLLQILEPGESPWQFELLGTQRLNERLMRGEPFAVLGTRQWPVRYTGVMVRGKFDLDGAWQYPPRQFSFADVVDLRDGGFCDES